MAEETTDAATATDDTEKKDATEQTEKKDELGEAGQKALDAFKSRARNAERENTALQARLKELEDKDKSELERAQSRVAELEKTTAGHDDVVRDLRVQVAVLREAAKVGIGDPDAATKLLDLSKLEIDDKTGEPVNVDRLLVQLLEDKPYLKSTAGKPQGTANGGEGDSASEGGSFNDQLRAQYARR